MAPPTGQISQDRPVLNLFTVHFFSSKTDIMYRMVKLVYQLLSKPKSFCNMKPYLLEQKLMDPDAPVLATDQGLIF